ncbi:MAG: tryptophan synthase subunit alpha [Actinomycetota bacterium]
MSPAERLAGVFAADRTAVMPFLVCGYPDPETFVELAVAAAQNGADVLEVGIPFSDPIMDGPVIAAATHEVLSRGTSVDQALGLLKEAIAESGLPTVAMTYYNLPFRRGLERFADELIDAGAVGAILPDLSVEDADPWLEQTRERDLASIFIAAQTSPDERLASIAKVTTGFIYAATLLGVTGVRETLSGGVGDLIARIRATTDTPVAAGIGVSTPQQAAEAAELADGVIVGSAITRLISDSDRPVEAVGRFVSELRAAVDRS